MITLPCKACGTEIPFPVHDESSVECPKCGVVRAIWSFTGGRAWDRWFWWALTGRRV